MIIRHRATTGTRTLLLFAIGILLITARVEAGSGGSVYSRFGIGDLSRTTSPELYGLGGTGLAVSPIGSVNDMNPAAWAGIGKVRFSAGAVYEGFSTTDGSSSVYLAATRFDGLTFAIPISPDNGITFASGLIPYSRVNYNIVVPETQSGLDYTMTYRGNGGISRAFAGFSATITTGFHAAARFEYLFGTLSYSMTQAFGTSSYSGASLVRSENVSGFGSTVGVLLDGLGAVLGMAEDRSLALGLTFSPATYPTSETERVYRYGATPSPSPPDSISEGERSFRLPFSFGSGLSYNSPNLLLALDARYQEWGRTGFETPAGVRLRNSVRLSAGARISRSADPNLSSSRRVTYAFGLFHESGCLEVNNTPIRENGITAGISFPILNETRLSFAASFSLRGSTDNLLQEDKIFRISASMDIAELWFQRPVEE